MCFAKRFLLHWFTISGTWQISFWTHAGSSRLPSGSRVIAFKAKHVSQSPSSPLTTLYAVPSVYFNVFIKKHPPSPTSAAWNNPLICQPHQSSSCFKTVFKKLPCHFLAPSDSFLLCDFDVVPQFNGNFPQQTGYVPPVTFFSHVFLDIWSNKWSCKYKKAILFFELQALIPNICSKNSKWNTSPLLCAVAINASGCNIQPVRKDRSWL